LIKFSQQKKIIKTGKKRMKFKDKKNRQKINLKKMFKKEMKKIKLKVVLRADPDL
jgi:hypothetical protein